MMKQKIVHLFLLVGLIGWLSSCYPEFGATVDELDLAITKVDEDQNFAGLNSFFLYDTVVYIDDGNGNTPGANRIDDGLDQIIIDQVRQNMLDIGWTEGTFQDGEIDADVALLVSALSEDVFYYYYYWWDYWDWWYWDPWYPWYPGYPVYPDYPSVPSYQYSVGTVLIEMISKDAIQIPAGDTTAIKVPVLWTGAVNGILAGSESNKEQRLNRQIKQVFTQSPYLHK